MIDTFAEAQGIEMNTLSCKAIFGQGLSSSSFSFETKKSSFQYFCVCEIPLLFDDLIVSGFVGDAPVLLAKPQTYMNLSGESVSDSDIYCLV